jgi:hypothetical protein
MTAPESDIKMQPRRRDYRKLMSGTKEKTTGNVTKQDVVKNKRGVWVSKRVPGYSRGFG